MPDAERGQDVAVRAAVYERVLTTGSTPSIAELASALGRSREAIAGSLERLAAGHELVLQRDSREVLMANPFSAVPTSFVVEAGGRRFHANCIWDAMGIPAMLAAPVRVEASCGCCGEAMRFDVGADAPPRIEGVVHFALPARRWWDDIVFN